MTHSLEHSSKQLVSFKVGAERYGIDVMQVQEVLTLQEATQVPNCSSFVTGLINLRGSIITTLDLREILNAPTEAGVDDVMNIIVRGNEETLSLTVDSVGEVLELDPSLFEPSPATLPNFLKPYVVGVHKLPDGLLLELDVSAIEANGSNE